ncbi:MAG: ATP-binding protein [Candidatus Methanomethyliaceae archaeon]|nr:ATP-binding protein [Candidatus Methanomethyliaceae archaeon]
MSKQFVDREEELNFLQERVRGNNSEFIIIYGRRRIGKTTLILEFIRRNGGIYLLARETSGLENLKRFSERIAAYFDDSVLRKNPFHSWDALLEYIYQKSKDRLIIAIDEFPYLVKDSRELLSILQEYWDLKLAKSKIFLILCGSSVSMMERMLGHKSPIYGRRTSQIRLKAMDFFNARAFLSNYSLEEFLKAYAILGGNPAYLQTFDDKKSIKDNLLKYFRSDSFLLQDAQFVLREELYEPRNYFAIMEAIARGKTTLGEIMNDTGMERAKVGKYLSVLIDLDLVKREVPINTSWKSRKGRYYISDPYFSFWFRYVQPNFDLIEAENVEALVELIIKDFNSYLGIIFEEVVRQFMLKFSRMKFTKIGRWWNGGEEIDFVGLNEQEGYALFLEVKWKELRGRDVEKIFMDLEKKAGFVDLGNYKKSYGIVGKKIYEKDSFKGFVWDLEDFEVHTLM